MSKTSNKIQPVLRVVEPETAPANEMAEKSVKAVKGVAKKKRRRRPAHHLRYVWHDSIKSVFVNVVRLLQNEGQHFDLKYDEFSRRTYCGDALANDNHVRMIAEWVQLKGCHAPLNIIADAVTRAAEWNSFHPVKDYLRQLQWDCVPRLDTLLIDHAGAEDTPLHRAQTSRWMIQAIARIYDPGCQADATLVLEGAQGIGKSTFLRNLFGSAWFTDCMPDLHKTDAMLQLRGIWLVELAELATLGRADTARIKQFLTCKVDRYREPYGRIATDVPRTCVFAGTVNPGGTGYLKDETGARRFWPIKLTKEIDVVTVAALRSQLWAEALARYGSGEKCYLHEPHLIAQATAAQAERTHQDPWQETIEDFIQERNYVGLGEVLGHIHGPASTAKWGQLELLRVASCLTRLGWERFQRRDGKRREWCYRPAGTMPTRRSVTEENWVKGNPGQPVPEFLPCADPEPPTQVAPIPGRAP